MGVTTLGTSTKVLIVVTSHGQLGTTGNPTGYYLPEVAHPWAELRERGIEVDIASPLGGKAPMDPKSDDSPDKVTSAALATKEFRTKLENTIPLSRAVASEYRAIVFAGGHGTMWDFPSHPDVNRLTREIFEKGGVVGAVCHGPAALVDVRLSDGSFLVAGRKVAAFSNAEEAAIKLTDVMPFLLETKLVSRGGVYSSAPLWQSHVVVDGRLVTGQNPASATGVGAEVAKLLTGPKS